jgi:hypothetical protein
MRTLPVLAAIFMSAIPVLVPSVSRADGFARPPVVFADPPGPSEADRLLEQADQLEAKAPEDDASATSMEKIADTLTARARSLRALAGQIADPGRSEMLAKAAGIDAEGNTNRNRAKQLRKQAADFRSSAQELRTIASDLNNGVTR